MQILLTRKLGQSSELSQAIAWKPWFGNQVQADGLKNLFRPVISQVSCHYVERMGEPMNGWLR